MKCVIWPFYSQQSKTNNCFRLDSDSGIKLCEFVAEQLVAEGCDVTTVRPNGTTPAQHGKTAYTHMPLSNLHRRLHWEPEEMLRICSGADFMFSTNEFLPYPVRCLLPDIRIALECSVLPEAAWSQTKAIYPLAWASATWLLCVSQVFVERAGRGIVCPFAYDERDLVNAHVPRTIDVLFNSRGSATGYSHSDIAVEAALQSPRRFVFTDPTGYLRTIGTPGYLLAEPDLSPVEYRKLVQRSKVVLALTDNGYGGHAFRESIRFGVCPVALRTPGYVEVLGDNWPYYVEELSAPAVLDAIERAFAGKLWASCNYACYVRAADTSYQQAWSKLRRLIWS